ncbi:Cyanobacterial protein [Geitlerinema sp. FC II]|nr:Cyanobacterial protein [Geitlerinema sp. FC II]
MIPSFLRQTSLAAIALIAGAAITVIGFGAYFSGNATLNLAGFFYGIPILLIGLALKSAELPPIPVTQETPPEVLKLREEQATDTQNQIRNDVTRYRYAERAHLLETLEHLGLSPNDKERPVLEGLREEAVDGAYALILEFDSPRISLETWKGKCDDMTTFFGPGVRVEVQQPDEDFIDVALISDAKA